MSTVKCKCEVCKVEFIAKVADRRRGWARCCSKRCSAIKRERHTGTYKANMALIKEAKEYDDRAHDKDCCGHVFASGFFGHGQE